MEPRRLNMHFLYQIVTSAYIYSLYEEEGEVFLHVLDLKTEESNDVFGVTIILDVLNEDPEVTLDDIVEVHDVIVAMLISKLTSN